MVASFVQVAPDSTGKKVQTFDNTVNAVANVQTNAVALVDQFGVPLGTPTAPLAIYGPDVVQTGNITTADGTATAPAGAGVFIVNASAATSLVAVAMGGGDTAWNAQITGTWAGTLYFEVSLDSTNGIDGNWIAVNGRQTGIINTVLANNTTTNGYFRGNTSGIKYFRVRGVAAAWTGTAAIVMRISDGVGAIFLNASIPAGSNMIGNVGTQGAAVASSTGPLTAQVASATGVANTTATVVAAVGTAGNATITFKGTFSGTYFFETSDDNGTTWYPNSAVRADTGIAAISTGPISTLQMWNISCPGITHLRVRCGTFVSGSATVLIAPGGFLATPIVAVQAPPRVSVFITSYQAAGIITTEALFAAAAFSRSADGAAATTGQQFTVTAGKRFRIQSIEVAVKNTAAAAGTSKLALRYLGAGGVIANTSPIAAIWDIGSNNAVAGNYIGPISLPIPDGMEFVGASTFGFTNLSSAATMLHTITVTGYEY